MDCPWQCSCNIHIESLDDDEKCALALPTTRPTMASTRSLPDLSLEALKREEDELDTASSPAGGLPSPDWSRASSPHTFTPSRSPSPEHDLFTPNPSHFFPALASPRRVPSPPRYHDDDEGEGGGFEDARSSTDDQEVAEGGPGTFTLHHPARGRSDYSIHSAPELDTSHMEESFLSDERVSSPTPSSPRSAAPKHYETLQRLPYTLWDYLQEEVRPLARR